MSLIGQALMQLLATTLPVLLHLRQHMEELEEVSCNAEAWHALHRGRLLRAGQEPTLPQLNETQRSAQLQPLQSACNARPAVRCTVDTGLWCLLQTDRSG